MALTSSSTIDDIKAAYADNSAYDINASLAEARLYIQACRLLILNMPKMSANDRASLSLSPELIEKQLSQAQSWLVSNGGLTNTASAGGQVRHADLSNFRDSYGRRSNGGSC